MTLPITGLDEISQSQAQKYLTHNTALRMLEGLMFRALSMSTDAEPGTPSDGDVYILTASATGTDWGTRTAGDVVVYNGGDWTGFTPWEGLSLWVNDEDTRVTYTGSAWQAERLLPSESGITASTTQSQGEQPLTAYINEISTCATTNDTVTAPALLAGMMLTVINNGAQTLQIFPASGEDLGSGTDTAVTVTAGNSALFACYSAGSAAQIV